jgi:hypothetical protein
MRKEGQRGDTSRGTADEREMAMADVQTTEQADRYRSAEPALAHEAAGSGVIQQTDLTQV